MGIKSPSSQSTFDGRVHFDKANGNLYANDGVNDFFRLGLGPDGAYSFDVARPGKDVRTASDTDLTMSSRFDQLRVVFHGIMAITRPASNSSFTNSVAVPAGAGAFIAYASLPAVGGNSSRVALPHLVMGISGASAGLLGYSIVPDYLRSDGLFEVTLYAPTNSPYYTQSQTVQVEYFMLSETLA